MTRPIETLRTATVDDAAVDVAAQAVGAEAMLELGLRAVRLADGTLRARLLVAEGGIDLSGIDGAEVGCEDAERGDHQDDEGADEHARVAEGAAPGAYLLGPRSDLFSRSGSDGRQ